MREQDFKVVTHDEIVNLLMDNSDKIYYQDKTFTARQGTG